MAFTEDIKVAVVSTPSRSFLTIGSEPVLLRVPGRVRSDVVTTYERMDVITETDSVFVMTETYAIEVV